MEKRKNKTRLARAAMTLLVMLFCFTGARAQQALPYVYGFENNDLAADGWTRNATSSSTGIHSDAKHLGSYGFRFSYSEQNASLISPVLTGGDNGIDVSFWYKEYSSSYGNEQFYVGYTTDENVTDPESFTYGDIITASTSWQQYENIFPAGTKRIAIKYVYNDAYYLFLDDFSFETVGSCPNPKNLNVTTDGETATVTWEGTADNYNIDINGTVTNNVTSPYTFNVELSTKYTVKVQASCGEGETSDWSNPLSFTTPDCIGGHVIEYTLNDSYGDGWNGNAINVVEGCGNVIATLTIENGNLNSGTLSLCSDYYEFVWVKGSYPGETSWTFTEGGITLFSGSGTNNMATGDMLYTIGTNTKPTGLAAGTPGTHEVALTWTPGNSETAWQLCINNNDETTVIDINNTNSTINEGTVSYTLTGLTANTEYSVMVRAFIDNDTQSCWSNPVTFTTAPTCPKPTNLVAGSIDTHSAVLSWTEEGEADQWQICINGDESNLIAVNENPFTLTNRVPETDYSVKVRAYCSAEDQSSWSDAVTFTTAPTCLKPTNLTAGTPDAHSVELSWTENGEATQWQICINDDETNLIDVNENPYTLTNLDPETAYRVKVRAYCSAEDQSSWSDVVTFTTAIANPAPKNLAVSDITPTSATVSWNSEATEFVLEYVEGSAGAGEWYQYDNGEFGIAIGTGGGQFSWGVMFPAGSYEGNIVNTVSVYDYAAMTGTVSIYNDGDTAPAGDAVSTMPITLTGAGEFVEVSFDSQAIDNTKNVWIVVYNESGASYPAATSTNNDEPNGRWVSIDGTDWADIANYDLQGCFMIRAEIGSDVDPSTLTWTSVDNPTSPCTLTGLNPDTQYTVRVKAIYGGENGESVWTYKGFTTPLGDEAPFGLATTDITHNSAVLSWTGYQESYNLKYRSSISYLTVPATIILTAGNIWDDGTGYQMLLDADATAYGTIIPETGGLTASGDASEETYAEFEYKIPTNADGVLTTENMVFDNSVTIQIPAGTYDWCITNPSPGDRVWIASSNGVGGRYDNFVFEPGVTYEFTIAKYGSNDGVDLTITRPMGDWITVEGISNPYELTGLTPETYYEWQVQGILDDGTTEWSEVATFATLPAAEILFAAEGYATYYNSQKDVVLPAGMKAHVVTDGSTNLTYAEVADGDTDGGNVVPAGTAVLLQVEPSIEAQTIPVYLATPSAAAYAGTNLLFGSDVAKETTGGAKYYKLTYSNSDDNFGWYWGAANGAAFTSPAHKAWLALPASSAPFLGLPGWEDTTGIVPVGVDPENGEWYTLQGLKIGKKPTTKGVYIHNGRKVVIK